MSRLSAHRWKAASSQHLSQLAPRLRLCDAGEHREEERPLDQRAHLGSTNQRIPAQAGSDENSEYQQTLAGALAAHDPEVAGQQIVGLGLQQVKAVAQIITLNKFAQRHVEQLVPAFRR